MFRRTILAFALVCAAATGRRSRCRGTSPYEPYFQATIAAIFALYCSIRLPFLFLYSINIRVLITFVSRRAPRVWVCLPRVQRARPPRRGGELLTH